MGSTQFICSCAPRDGIVSSFKHTRLLHCIFEGSTIFLDHAGNYYRVNTFEELKKEFITVLPYELKTCTIPQGKKTASIVKIVCIRYRSQKLDYLVFDVQCKATGKMIINLYQPDNIADPIANEGKLTRYHSFAKGNSIQSMDVFLDWISQSQTNKGFIEKSAVEKCNEVYKFVKSMGS